MAAAVLPAYEALLGVPYPLPKLDLAALPDFAASAMENWGLVVYRETALLAGNTSGIQQRREVALTIAHELAHMVGLPVCVDCSSCPGRRDCHHATARGRAGRCAFGGASHCRQKFITSTKNCGVRCRGLLTTSLRICWGIHVCMICSPLSKHDLHV